MSGTDQNPYPSCIKCNKEINPQDSRGWEKIETHQTDGGKGPEIWLCPACIKIFTACQDMKKGLEKQIFAYEECFALLNKMLKENQAVG